MVNSDKFKILYVDDEGGIFQNVSNILLKFGG